MNKLSYKVSLGGIIAALALVTMFLTGFGPFLTYLCPAVAGGLLIMVVIEISAKWAFATYVAISILSLLMTPDREAAMLFIFLLGYYPIIKSKLEKIKNPVVEWITKMGIFNLSVISAYVIIIQVFGMGQLLESVGDWGKYGVLIFLGCANVVFVMYDIALSGIISTYITTFRPKFLRKINK